LNSGQFPFIVDIAQAIRDALLPHLSNKESKRSEKVAYSGDTTFYLDIIAEEALERAVKNSEHELAFFSEDKGLVKFSPNPEWLLIVDPIDGTRPLVCGFEMGVISIALCGFSQNTTFNDILASVILEIKTGDLYFAEQGKGVRLSSSTGKRLQPSSTRELRKMFWSYDVVGRPAQWICDYLGKLIEISGMEAGVFLFNNAAFSLTRILTGQLDAYVEVGGRILTDHPESESEFVKIGCGRVMGTFPYDIAAAHLILKEANCVITDGYGQGLENHRLLQHGKEAVLSCIAASNPELHGKILESLPELN
jgi:myo-inositol-1(or 4)-monophosphatase